LVNPLAIVAALAPLLVTGGLAIVAVGEAAGSHPLTIGPPRGAAEAIAIGDPATAVRLIEGGAAVNDVGVIRAGILGDRPVLATPLETAVIVNQAGTVEFLIGRGAEQPASLSCLAADAHAAAVRAQLHANQSCQPGEALRVVLARP
jgi:hypothetical protein